MYNTLYFSAIEIADLGVDELYFHCFIFKCLYNLGGTSLSFRCFNIPNSGGRHSKSKVLQIIVTFTLQILEDDDVLRLLFLVHTASWINWISNTKLSMNLLV